MDPSCTLGFYCRDKADFEMFCAQVNFIFYSFRLEAFDFIQWNHTWHMASEDRRSCPIFRIERGTFQESHSRTLNYEYPTSNDDDVCLRVTKLSSSSSSLNKPFPNQNKPTLVNSTATNSAYRDSWDDTGRSLHENSNVQAHSLSDDYVFL